jgi:hypothetical protein
MNTQVTTVPTLVEDIEGFLQEIVTGLDDSAPQDDKQAYYAGRKKILPSLVLWSGVIVGVLRGFTAQAEIWRLVSWKGFWNYEPAQVSDQAVYNRLAEQDQTLQKLFVQVRDGLRERLVRFSQDEIAPFASGVYAIDGSTLDKILRHLPALRDIANGDSRLLPGKMVGLFDIRLQQWHDMLHFANPNQNDKVAARELIQGLPEGSLILADLGFFAFEWFDQLTEWKMWWLSRMRNKITFEVFHTFYQEGDLFDGIVWLGKYRADRAAHAVRLVTFTVGKKHYRYITNVLDPQKLSMHDIAVLYARRWDIELAFKMVKRHLNLHLIWSSKPAIVLQQLWAVLIIAQLLHAVQLEIAGLAQVDPFDVSLELVTRYVPQLAQEGKDPLEMIVRDGRRVGIIRPSRRIRPQTPATSDLAFQPLPANTVLKRKPRYANRRGRPQDHPGTQATKASSFEPLLC